MPVLSPSSALTNVLRFGAVLVQARITILSNGVPVTTEYVPVSTMTVTVDRNSAQRRTGTITVEAVPSVPPPAMLPTNPQSMLAPFGNEVYIETGIATMPPGSTTEAKVAQWIPMGLFSIATSQVVDTGVDCVVSLSIYDRSWVISQRKLLTPYTFPATKSGEFAGEIQKLLNQVWDNPANPLQYNIVPTTATVPQASYNQGSDPWQAALDMAASVGYELFFNAYGVVTALPIPVPADQPVTWRFTDNETAIYGLGGSGSGGGSSVLFGSPYSTPVDVTVTMTRDGIYNDVIVTGTGTSNTPTAAGGTGQPVLASASDNNPLSATYVNGPVGNIPEFVSTNLTTSSSQAQDMANNDLQAALSAAWQVTITFPPGAVFLDIDDIVEISRPRIGLQQNVVIDTLEYQISYADTCKLTGRVVPS